jgi:protein gp37
MAGNSNIEWTEQTWNPIVGCSIVSPGCTNCYAMKMAARIEAMGNQPRYAGTTRVVNGNKVWTGKLAQAPDSALLAPLKRKKPTTYFVNSMGDLFHEDCPDEWIDKVFAVMALSPQHTFQVLTKRAERMRDYFKGMAWGFRVMEAKKAFDPMHRPGRGGMLQTTNGVLPNVWLGVSTERQQEADERIPLLLQTPAAVRFISAEPLLGPIDLMMLGKGGPKVTDALQGCVGQSIGDGEYEGAQPGAKLDWVIVGGESGKDARPMHPDWARSLRDQCAAAGVAFFLKQWGEYLPWSQFNGAAIEDDPEQTRFSTFEWDGERWDHIDRPMWCDSADGNIDDAQCVGRVGKKAAGRHLDGVLHDAMPQADGRGRG